MQIVSLMGTAIGEVPYRSHIDLNPYPYPYPQTLNYSYLTLIEGDPDLKFSVRCHTARKPAILGYCGWIRCLACSDPCADPYPNPSDIQRPDDATCASPWV